MTNLDVTCSETVNYLWIIHQSVEESRFIVIIKSYNNQLNFETTNFKFEKYKHLKIII